MDNPKFQEDRFKATATELKRLLTIYCDAGSKAEAAKVFNSIYLLLSKILYTFVMRRFGTFDASQIETVIHDVFLEIVKLQGKSEAKLFAYTGKHQLSWCFTVARYKAIRVIREESCYRRYVDAASSELQQDNGSFGDQDLNDNIIYQSLVRKVLPRLKGNQRLVGQAMVKLLPNKITANTILEHVDTELSYNAVKKALEAVRSKLKKSFSKR